MPQMEKKSAKIMEEIQKIQTTLNFNSELMKEYLKDTKNS